MNGWGIFSTLRVAQGVLFAYHRHYARMQRDAERMRVPFDLSPSDFQSQLHSLLDSNSAYDATLRVAVVRNRGGIFAGPKITHETDLIAFTADLQSWGTGVKLTYVPHGRYGASPFAGRKITSWAENLTWYEDAHQRGFDEVVLLNETGQVSECTSANIFAVYGDHVYTPPLETSGCLPGVTRALLLEEIRVPGITIAERELSPSDLEAADQVFITSTTRDLLPVFEVDHEPLHQDGRVLHLLQSAFAEYRSHFVANHSHRNEIFAA